MLSRFPSFCICAWPWKKCFNKRWCKKRNADEWYNIPYTIGMAELGYEYDFIRNRKIKCIKNMPTKYF